MNRRKFLLVFTALIITTVGLLLAWRIGRYRLRDLISPLVDPRLDERSPSGVLSEEEMATIALLPGTLLPTFNKLHVDERLIKDHVNQTTMNTRGYLKEYRSAARLLDETSKTVIGSEKSFAKLSSPERGKVLDSILWTSRVAEILKGRLELLSPGKEVAFRNFVVRDIIPASFRVAPALQWAIVGYSHYPGTPAAGLEAYTRTLQPSLR